MDTDAQTLSYPNVCVCMCMSVCVFTLETAVPRCTAASTERALPTRRLGCVRVCVFLCVWGSVVV
jgi:hypothetical protein